jgi:hypothetical protein
VEKARRQLAKSERIGELLRIGYTLSSAACIMARA